MKFWRRSVIFLGPALIVAPDAEAVGSGFMALYLPFSTVS
jgi:hypothetical protein